MKSAFRRMIPKNILTTKAFRIVITSETGAPQMPTLHLRGGGRGICFCFAGVKYQPRCRRVHVFGAESSNILPAFACDNFPAPTGFL